MSLFSVEPPEAAEVPEAVAEDILEEPQEVTEVEQVNFASNFDNIGAEKVLPKIIFFSKVCFEIPNFAKFFALFTKFCCVSFRLKTPGGEGT